MVGIEAWRDLGPRIPHVIFQCILQSCADASSYRNLSLPAFGRLPHVLSFSLTSSAIGSRGSRPMSFRSQRDELD